MVFPVGFGRGITNRSGTAFQLLAIMFTEFFGVTLAQLVGALAPTIQVGFLSSSQLGVLILKNDCLAQVGMLFNSAIAIPLFVTCGVIIPYANIRHWMRVWLYELNPWVRITSSMYTTELQ